MIGLLVAAFLEDAAKKQASQLAKGIAGKVIGVSGVAKVVMKS
jgi:hypothetical protein